MAAEKDAAVAQARSFAGAGNECAALDFILQCKFADARLEAATHIRSRETLEKLAQAMRETDRRVARLAHHALDAIRQRELAEEGAAACIERLHSLAGDPVILPNRLAEIERAWTALQQVSQERMQQFEQARSALQQRLHEQTALQRMVIALRDDALSLANMPMQTLPSSPADTMGVQLDALAERFSRCRAAPEAPSLPASLLSDTDLALGRARGLLEGLTQRRMAVNAHEQAYSAWEGNTESLTDLDVLRRALRALPPLAPEDAHLFDQRRAHLQARLEKAAAPSAPVRATAPAPAKIDMAVHRRTLEALERALEEGALQLASELEKELRAADNLALPWKGNEAARLARARAELNRLKGWARWGGQVSREELIKSAEDLRSKESNPSELAKKVGSLRSQWKSMDSTSGAADRDTWLRFDAACTAAYAPAAAHFLALAEERKANLENAQALIVQVKDAAMMLTDEADWRERRALCSRMTQAWHAIGPVERKAKKVLDSQFAEAMNTLSAPLLAAQQEEMQRREDLIAQAMRLEQADGKSMAALRQLQQQWQQQAKSLPLERKDEQALWRRFRVACDAHAQRRKADLHEIDAQHAENLRQKHALCEVLESSADSADGQWAILLRDTEQRWKQIGPVARSDEQALNERYRRAVSGIEAALASERNVARRAELARIYEKLALCMDVEQAIVDAAPGDAAALEHAWREYDAAPDAYEGILRARFENALAALRNRNGDYLQVLQQRRTELERDLLRMEIGLELDSPPELSAQRLQLQVEALQASLKSRAPGFDQTASVRKLCETPAAYDSASRARVQRVFERLARSGE